MSGRLRLCVLRYSYFCNEVSKAVLRPCVILLLAFKLKVQASGFGMMVGSSHHSGMLLQSLPPWQFQLLLGWVAS
jgi:hypothetical protein